MAYPKLTGFMIGLILVSMFAGIFSLFIVANPFNLGNTSAVNISKYNQFEALHNQTENIKSNTKTIKQQSGVFDLVGGFFSNAYQVLTAIPDSINIFDDMTDQAILDSNLGEGGTLIKNTIETIILIIIFVGVLLSALIKWVL